MDVNFTFRYKGGDGQPFEIAEASSEYFSSLFNCDAALLRQNELWKSFIQEYREGRQSFQDWLMEQTDDDWQQFMHQQRESPESQGGAMFWGPSAVFPPSEAADWANAWKDVLESLGPDELLRLFPLDVNPRTRQSTFDKPGTVEALRHVAQQAECAQTHGAGMTVEMALG